MRGDQNKRLQWGLHRGTEGCYYGLSLIAAVTSIIAGVGVALAVNAVGGGRVPVAASATVGAVVTVMSVGAFGWHQLRRWRTAEASVPSLYPSQPGRAPGLDPLPIASSQPEG